MNYLFYVQLAKDAYFNSETNTELKNVSEFSVKNIQGFTAIHNDEFIVAFRGSESIEEPLPTNDWFSTDFEFWKTKGYNNIPIHSGFYKAWAETKDIIFDAFVKSKLKTIVFTGHSMGAAIATVASLGTKLKFPGSIVKNINFGSPRVGGIRFAFNYKKVDETYRFTYGRDLVPHVPFLLMPKINFWHKIPYLTLTPFIHSSKSIYLKVLKKRGLLEFFKTFLKDHEIKNYIDAIKKTLN